jgi:hypothetical protein
LIMLLRLPISSTTSFLILSHPKQCEMHLKKTIYTLLPSGNVLSSKRPIDRIASNLPDIMRIGQ